MDIFSYGIVLCEIITRRKISRELQRKPEEAFALNPNDLNKLIPSDCPEALKQLAIKCADYTPENRPSFLQILDSLAAIEKELREGRLLIILPANLHVRDTNALLIRHNTYHWRRTLGSGTLYTEARNLGSFCVRDVFRQHINNQPDHLHNSSKRFVNKTEKREASATVEKTKLALAPKTKFAIMRYYPLHIAWSKKKYAQFTNELDNRRSIDQKRGELAKAHDVSQMQNLGFSNPDAFYDALFGFGSITYSGWYTYLAFHLDIFKHH